MSRRTTKHEEDSGSDWDSMSEIGPPPPSVRQPGQNYTIDRPTHNQQVTAPHKLKSMTFVDPHMNNAQPKDNPPYDFKPEVVSPVRAEPSVKPGKGRKGRTYDPHQYTTTTTSPPKHVTFDPQEDSQVKKPVNGGGPREHESDSEDPLYSTVKPRGNNRHMEATTVRMSEPDTETKDRAASRPKRKLPGINFKNKKLEGVDNGAFEVYPPVF